MDEPEDLLIDLDIAPYEEHLTLAMLLGIRDDVELDTASAEFADLEDMDPFNMPFDEAIAYLTNKTPELFDKIEPITREAAQKYFYIKKSTDLQATKAVLDSLEKSLSSGGTIRQWKKDIASTVNNAGFGDNPWYLNLVWRNNMHSAYNQGAYIQQEENSDNKPNGLYDAIEDSRTSSICDSLNGKVYPLDHSFWTRFMPPNHHNCRSRRIALSDEDVAEAGLKVTKTFPRNLLDLVDKAGTFAGTPGSKATMDALVNKRDIEVLNVKSRISKIKPYVPKATTQEAMDDLFKFMGFRKNRIDIDLLKMPVDVANGIVEKYYTIIKKWPKLKGHCYGLGMNENRSLAYASCEMRSAAIELNPKHFKTAKAFEKLKESVARDIKTSFHPEGTNPMSILTHELGHALDGWSSSKLGYRAFTNANKSFVSDEIVTQVRKEFKIIHRTDVRSMLSEYANEDPQEFFAEAFSEYMDSPNPRPVAKRVGELFEKKMMEASKK